MPNGEMGLEKLRWRMRFIPSRRFDGMLMRDVKALYTTRRGPGKFLGQAGIWPGIDHWIWSEIGWLALWEGWLIGALCLRMDIIRA